MKEEYIKDFDAWNDRAKLLNSKEFNDFFYAREIWWCALGTNIGSEQDGKNESFERPVLILRKINPSLLLIAPLTSKITKWDYRINIKLSGEESQILVEQIRTISSKRLLRKITVLKVTLFLKVIMSLLHFILTFAEDETPPVKAGNLGARRPL
ncbi:MAG: type II toxin-antitoxin system PemK/MazF family toxin [Patescibacteria group bacterium]